MSGNSGAAKTPNGFGRDAAKRARSDTGRTT